MAAASSRVLTCVSGRIDNNKPHYAFVRNGKQYIACVRNGWNTELKTDTQKITALRFAYATAISNMLSAVQKAGKSQKTKLTISYLFRTVKVGKKTFFFDDTLFDNVNAVMSHYFDPSIAGSQFFVQFSEFFAHSDQPIPLYQVADQYANAIDNKTAFRYSLASFLMNNADKINLTKMYDDLSKVKGAEYDESDIYPLADVYEIHGFLMLNLYQWAKVPVLEITPENYANYIEHKSSTDHRKDFPEYIAEQAFPPYAPEY